MATKLSNNATTRLAASISATATQISVTAGDGSKFPTLGPGDSFPITLVKSDGQYEIVKCTARSGDLLTIQRAQEGSTPKAFTAGDRAELRMTEATLDAYTKERANKASTDAVTNAIATDVEATARSSKTTTLSPYGLGLNVQSSPNDTTPDKLLAVGKSFGLGSTGAGSTYDVWPSASLDDLNVPAGIYLLPSSIADRPPVIGNQNAIVWHRQAGSAGAQLIVAASSRLVGRSRLASVYSAWSEYMRVGDYGWGGQQSSPPNGRGNANPTGWYYSTSPVPFGGGVFFVDFKYGSAERGGMRISTDPYTDDFYFQGWKTSDETWRDACKLWHDKNLNPDDFQPKGSYQPALGYTPVNKAGDQMAGNLSIKKSIPTIGLVSDTGGVAWEIRGNFTGATDYGVQFWNIAQNAQIFRIGGNGQQEVFVREHQVWHGGNFNPNTKANAGALCAWTGTYIEFGATVSPGGTFLADCPQPYVLAGLRTVSGFNTIYLRGTQLKNQ